MDFTDEALIGEIRGGSSVAFERLMQRYERLVFKIALGFTGDADSALDVSQNVFLRVHGKLGTWRGEGELRNWIARMAANEALNWNRGEKRHRAAGLDHEAVDGSPSRQQDALEQRENRRLVRRSLDSLNSKQRRAVILRYFADLPIHDVAAALECSEGVAKNVLFRSLRRMRAWLEASTEVRR